MKRLGKIIVSFALILCTLTASVMILPESAFSAMEVYAATQKLTVTANKVNVRSGAGTGYSRIATANKGDVFTSLGTAKDSSGKTWYKISVNGKTGYIISTYVKVTTVADTTTKTTAKPATSGTFTAKSAAGAYAQPTKSAAKSATMTAGTAYNYTAVYTGGDGVKWYLAKVGNATGWVCSSDVTLGGTVTSAQSTTKTTTSTTKPATSGTLTAKSAAGAYAQPTKSAAKSATMTAGTAYTYTAVYTGGDGVKWYLVKVGNITGWVCSSDVTLGGTVTSAQSTTKTTTSTTKPATSGTLTAKSAAGAYAQPTKSSAKSATMTAGTAYNYTAVYTGGDGVKWYLVKVGNMTGWVCSSDVTLGGTVTSTSTSATTSSTTSTTQSTTESTTSSTQETSSTESTSSTETSATSSTTKVTTTTTSTGKYIRANSAVGIYASPTTSSTKVATLVSGQTYQYSSVYTGGDNVTWYLVEPTPGVTGWVCGKNVTNINATTATTAPPNGSASVTTVKTGVIKTGGSTLRVRESASTSASVLGQIANGTKVVIAGQTTGTTVEGTNVWYKIVYGSGYGYVSAAYVTNITTSTQNITIKFGASYYYVNVGSTVNAAISGAGITYTSSNSTNAPISASGVVTGKVPGVYKITATLGGVTATADVVVLAKPNTDVKAMTISAEGTAFIAGWEGGGTYVSGLGTVFYPYKDVSGYWTVGYGHAKTTTASKSWNEATAIAQFNIDITNLIGEEHILTDEKPYLTNEEATKLLNADLNNGPYVIAVSDWAIRNGIKLNQQQFDALVSFCYNLGPAYWTNDSNKFYLKSAIIAHRDGSQANANQIIDGFTRYMKSGGLNYKGLWWRRRNEAEMFISGDYNIDRGEKFPLPTNITWA
ncbi:MAG: SH3 domain-containing protein [Clostridia bacterium]|nr:SH3 domain-containing protein [Clostridia bacterium]